MWIRYGTPELEDISQWREIITVCVGLTLVTIFTVTVRLYVRTVIIQLLGIDDYVIIASMSRFGLGLPVALRPHADLKLFSLLNFSGRPFYMTGITGFKVALCSAYLRMIGTRIKFRYRYFIWSVMLFTILSHLGGTLVLIFQCDPVRKSWLPDTPGRCLPNNTTFYILAAITIFCDIVILLTPIPLLVQLQMDRRRKTALIGIFMLGLFTTVCSVMRMIQIMTITKNGNSTMLVLWGTIEMNVGVSPTYPCPSTPMLSSGQIFLTCLPSLTPLFSYFRPQSRSANYSRSHSFERHRINPEPCLGQASNLEISTLSTSPKADKYTDSKGTSLSDQRTGGEYNITKTTEIDIHESGRLSPLPFHAWERN